MVLGLTGVYFYTEEVITKGWTAFGGFDLIGDFYDFKSSSNITVEISLFMLAEFMCLSGECFYSVISFLQRSTTSLINLSLRVPS